MNTDELEEASSTLSFLVEDWHFVDYSNLKVRCTASIYSKYQKAWEISILPDRPPNKSIYQPEIQRYPTYITDLPHVKLSRSNVHIDKVFDENSKNNVIIEGTPGITRDFSSILVPFYLSVVIFLFWTVFISQLELMCTSWSLWGGREGGIFFPLVVCILLTRHAYAFKTKTSALM